MGKSSFARADGFAGMLAIHPGQIAVINEVFTPTPDEIARARDVVELFARAPAAGVVSFEGRMLDMPHLKQARRLLAFIEEEGEAR